MRQTYHHVSGCPADNNAASMPTEPVLGGQRCAAGPDMRGTKNRCQPPSSDPAVPQRMDLVRAARRPTQNTQWRDYVCTCLRVSEISSERGDGGKGRARRFWSLAACRGDGQRQVVGIMSPTRLGTRTGPAPSHRSSDGPPEWAAGSTTCISQGSKGELSSRTSQTARRVSRLGRHCIFCEFCAPYWCAAA
ncbi:hypothetical protein BS50DRAFT_142132 [Corynespora cassiicola Philippines]|uniref:Uncharacterized protein n=1 Tax=Corynespora cassiicola Philippines TaxID=1448308 RepID=A0A2T2NAA5_CORCC|nr:hypothetical protein BS50DRAFT_142132 [Corynespora cassiicola Philippines]